MVHPQIDGTERCNERSEEVRLLVPLRVVAARSMTVVVRQRLRQRRLRESDVPGEFRRGLGRPLQPHPHEVDLEDLLAHDQVHLALLFEEGSHPDASGVGVLVHEPLAACVHEDAARQAMWWTEWESALDRVHVLECGPAPLAEADTSTVVVGLTDAPRHVGRQCGRAVAGQHVVVEDEPAGGQYDTTARSDRVGLVVHLHDCAGHRSITIHHESFDARVGDRARRRGIQRAAESLHEEATGGVGKLWVMTTRHRVGDVDERPRVFAAGEHQTGVVDGLAVRFIVELGLERHAVVDQPVVVRHRVRAVRVDLGGVGPGPARREQEPLHVLGGVGVPARRLDRRPATEIDEATGERRRASRCDRPFDRQD